MPLLLLASAALLGGPASARRADSLDVARLAAAPVLDGAASEREYGAPALRIRTAAGDVRVWIGRHGGFVYVAASLPDSTLYWGDDLVVSLDPDGSGGVAPSSGDRQWYLRRVLDSSMVLVAADGRWQPRDGEPRMLGAVRRQADWDVASASSSRSWSVELRVRADAVRPGAAAPRLAIRTYDDRPSGWWSWPAPPAGVPAQRVERQPELWVPLRVPPGRDAARPAARHAAPIDLHHFTAAWDTTCTSPAPRTGPTTPAPRSRPTSGSPRSHEIRS